MKSTLQLSLLLLTLVSLNLAAQQSCNINIRETAPASRFIVNVDGNGAPDGTVSDRQTGLMWARCPQGLSGEGCDQDTRLSFTWPAALTLNGTRPTSVPTGDTSGTDWRLPNVKELQSLVERSCFSPAINETVFPNTPTLTFWSASPDAFSADDAWGVSFFNGIVSSINRDNEQSVRLVRGGQ